MSVNIQNSWIGGLVAALAASLCCITPLLAIFGGISGAATYFNWIEPFRPYIIGLTMLIFAVAWYQQLAVVRRGQEDCCEPVKRSFWKSKKFLLVVTLFSGVVIAFPYYSSFFYKTTQPIATITPQAKFKFVKLNIKGMGCADCTKHIDGVLMGLNGVSASNTSFENAETAVRYDPTKTNTDSINLKIKEIGYQSTLIKNN
ncbi:mercuric transport protein MerTP [Mucilaginibacter rubeus]|uniref:Mercuric transport protein MerT n=1 Tax=Mucilaginibacter rubeus TaxID=2027860 RepID=A0AAE6MKS7_9SPHI|nr:MULTISPECIES: mercuric transport protein MerTP [Mucilaginibacter]PMP66349.1 MAG: heavy metal transporter [Mucilaginibacter sp.]HEK21101.1 mercuric transport protein MerTP [Bacteroidota bacterium]NHA05659.1 mercuric transport protein MerTP [Mucilaginibacter inviolabilis]QEM07025.1 mercuric transport protein MerTP [Mucilaginibacter rubeus]QTE35463.1 mercuric transport protein MerTP [Mucilaginibacter gossypii]